MSLGTRYRGGEALEGVTCSSAFVVKGLRVYEKHLTMVGQRFSSAATMRVILLNAKSIETFVKVSLMRASIRTKRSGTA